MNARTADFQLGVVTRYRFRVDVIGRRRPFYVETNQWPSFTDLALRFIDRGDHEVAAFTLANVIRWVRL